MGTGDHGTFTNSGDIARPQAHNATTRAINGELATPSSSLRSGQSKPDSGRPTMAHKAFYSVSLTPARLSKLNLFMQRLNFQQHFGVLPSQKYYILQYSATVQIGSTSLRACLIQSD